MLFSTACQTAPSSRVEPAQPRAGIPVCQGMKTLVFLAGLAQVLVASTSLAIPTVLRWREDTAKLRPLTRPVFWTYAGYIWATNLSFGLQSLAGGPRGVHRPEHLYRADRGGLRRRVPVVRSRPCGTQRAR